MKKIITFVATWFKLSILIAFIFSFALILQIFIVDQNNKRADQVGSTEAYPAPGVLPTEVISSTNLLQAPYPPYTEISPFPTISPGGIQICKFPLETEYARENRTITTLYEFSEPQVILTDKTTFDIAEWLPDSQRILITRQIPESSRQYIEILDTLTGSTQRYGEGAGFSTGINGFNKPVWLDNEQAVAFTNYAPDYQFTMDISYEGGKVQEIVSNLASAYLAADPTGQQIIFFSRMDDGGAPSVLTIHQGLTTTLATNIHIPVENNDQMDYLLNYQPAWFPDGTRIAFYNKRAIYLSTLATGDVCELYLGQRMNRNLWAALVKWSPDGHYLAALITVGEPAVPFLDLMLIDVTTGEHHRVSLGGGQNIYTMTWAPDSRTMLIVASDTLREERLALYLVDVATGESKRILETYPLESAGYANVAWSPNGDTIALTCSVLNPDNLSFAEGRLCIMKVVVK